MTETRWVRVACGDAVMYFRADVVVNAALTVLLRGVCEHCDGPLADHDHEVLVPSEAEGDAPYKSETWFTGTGITIDHYDDGTMRAS
jgi:hypothetical protein